MTSCSKNLLVTEDVLKIVDVALATNVGRVETDALPAINDRPVEIDAPPVTNAARAGNVALHRAEEVYGILAIAVTNAAHLGSDAHRPTNDGLVVSVPLIT